MTHRNRLFCSVRGAAIVLASAGMLLAAAESAFAEMTTTRQDATFRVFVPCANDGNGELVEFNLTLMLVIDDLGRAVHGNWQNATGIGLDTGDEYIGSGSTSNLIRTSDDGEYLSSFSWIAKDPGGAKFTITRIGALFQPPTKVLQVHCR